MSKWQIVILVLFVITMFLWLLLLLDAFGAFKYTGWLPWFACMELGAMVFIDRK